jgi:hypothetical protein
VARIAGDETTRQTSSLIEVKYLLRPEGFNTFVTIVQKCNEASIETEVLRETEMNGLGKIISTDPKCCQILWCSAHKTMGE